MPTQSPLESARRAETSRPQAFAGTRIHALVEASREAGREDLAAEATRLGERIAEGRFFVACVGQFKRGKSSLLNALIGETVLPVGVVPVTAIVTIVRHGAAPTARARFAGGEWREAPIEALADYVSEERNPENAKAVGAVEVFVPSPLLASGLCLVDTPGIGSVFAANTAATQEFVPHIDAALVVLGADPPLSGDELSLVESVAKGVQDIIFVLNKADRMSDSERLEASAFAERVLARRLRRPLGSILQVSAAEQLAGKPPREDWQTLVTTLETLSRESGEALVARAAERGMALLRAQLVQEVDARKRALEQPLGESEAHMVELGSVIQSAERSLQDLSFLFAAEQERLALRLEEQRLAFLERALPEAKQELSGALGAAAQVGRRRLRERASTLAREVTRRWLDTWRREEQPVAEAKYKEAAQRFVDLANQFIDKLAQSGAVGPAGLPHVLTPEAGFRARSGLHYIEMLTLTTASALAWLLSWAHTRQSALKAASRFGEGYVEQLLTVNSARIMNDLKMRTLESRRLLETEIRSRLRDLRGVAERALAGARSKYAEGEGAVAAERERLLRLRERVETLAPSIDELA